MKTATRSDYADRIDRVIARLQRAVSAGGVLPDLPELAAIAHLSPFHFHRVYRALTGETLGRTVARLRLSRALHLLADDAASVTDVALAVGYETPQAFARAFREAFDTSPSELRLHPERLTEESQRLSRPRIGDAGASSPLRVEVVSIEPFEVVALRNRGEYADLDRIYGRLFAWASEAGIVDEMTGLYGVPLHDHRDVPAAEVEFDCALAFSIEARPPAPMRVLRLGGGDYARVRHVGSFDDIEAATDRVLADWLPGSGYALRDVPVHYCYLDDPEHVPETMLRADIFLPVEKEPTP